MEQAPTRHRSLLILCSVLSLISGGLIGFFTPHPLGQPIEVTTPDPTNTPLPTPTPGPLRVYVSGAVVSPAVYLLHPGSLVDDAVRSAGGPRQDADMDNINLAHELFDQQQVYVPRIGERNPPPPLSGGTDPVEASSRININTATLSELQDLPQVGPATAQSIIEYRETYGPFQEVDDLLQVPGIGSATLQEIRELIATE